MRKQINLTVVHEDVGKLLQTALSQALQRNQTKREELLAHVLPAIENNDRAAVTAILIDLVHTDEALKEEINLSLPLLEILGDDLITPDTEVVEDLPDLEEDSLGVSSGSE